MDRKLTLANAHFFFSRLKVGDVFTYSGSFLPEDVSKRGKEVGLNIKYCAPGTKEYKEHGAMTCKVIND